MAGTFAEARAQILSLQPAALKTRSTQVRSFGTASTGAGTTLSTSADEVGAQRGTPYAAYRDRVAPTGAWLTRMAAPAADMATGLQAAAGAGERAQMVLAQQEEALARYGSNPGVTPEMFAIALAQALATLNAAIAEVTGSYAAIAPPAPGAAPVVAEPGGADSGSRSGTAAATAVGTGGATGSNAAAFAGSESGSGAGGQAATALGPQSGPFAWFVQDPTTGNLIDPATGREVEPGGRFLDPVTGVPFGDPSQFTSRLEGLVGGVPGVVAGIGAGGAGVLGVTAPIGAPTGVAAGGLGAGGFGAGAGGVAPFLAPGLVGGGAAGAAGARGGAGRFAGLYGGTLPPSLGGNNPASSQLLQTAAVNMETKAGVAQRYAAIASGQAASGMGFMPPPMMGGFGGGGAAGGARSGRAGGSRAGGESRGMWGGAVPATGNGRPERRRSRASSTDVEDDDVWTGGGHIGSDILEGRR